MSNIDPMLMRQIIMDHYDYPRNKKLTDNKGYMSRHMASDSCIDDITVQTKISDGKIDDIRFDGVACTISTASTSIMSELLKGKTTQEAKEIMDNVSKVIVGKEDVTKLVLTSLIAGGHVLLEDVPGTGKTMLAKTVAKSVDAQFSRIQFTPDLLPSDVTGINYYNQKAGEFVFRKGPVFANILLADEINRATPRTQSALLECMEEHQVTVDSDTYRLEEPFLVIATQNPIETAGTYQLPEAQLDRFLMKICMGYPEKDGEIEILNRFLKASPLTSVESVCSKEEVLKMQQEAKEVYVHPSLMDYIVDIAAATRKHSSVAIGVSPRGTLTMVNAARAFAYIEGREYIVPEDIRILAEPVFAHRLVLRHGLTYQDNRNALMQTIMESVEVPTEDWGK